MPVHEVQFNKPDVDPKVIEMMEEWLQRAKDGKIVAISVAAVTPDRVVQTQWTGAGLHLHELVSATTMLQHRMLAMNCEEDI